MQVVYIFLVFLPIVLFFTGCFLIVNLLKTRRLRTRTNAYTLVLMIAMAIVLTWYNYPIQSLFGETEPASVMIRVRSESIELSDKDQIIALMDTINDNTYRRSASKNLTPIMFPSENLIQIDLVFYEEGQKSVKIAHLYVLSYFENEDGNDLEALSRGSVMQINNQFYSIKETEDLSEAIYQHIKAWDFFDTLKM